MEARAVLDTSAVLALLLQEPGSAVVEEVIPFSLISTVNLAELVGKLVERRGGADRMDLLLTNLGLQVAVFDRVLAEQTGRMIALTCPIGLSLGDRACLALAAATGLPAYTADRRWAEVQGPARVVLIR
jgi:PIN domain nuclease of toxin-antitoxin system